jgi:hypothetical protein
MPVTVNWGTKVINIPQSYLTPLGGSVYELDLDAFRLDLKDLEDDAEGMPFADTHMHNTEVTFSGVTLARVILIINGYTVTFEDGQYAVEAKGANSNLADVMNLNQVSLRSFNTAGLITVVEGSGLTTEEHDALMAAASDAEFIKNIEGGKWEISGSQMIFYKEDNVTEIARFDITYDVDGNPIMRARV